MLSAGTAAEQLFVFVYNRGSHSGIDTQKVQQFRRHREFATQTR